MMKKVMLGIKATLQGGTKYERSIRKTLKNDWNAPKEKHLIRIVKGLSEQDEETSLAKAEELFTTKLIETSEQPNHILLQLKLLFVLDSLSDNRLTWKTKEAETMLTWLDLYFKQDSIQANTTTQPSAIASVRRMVTVYARYLQEKITLLSSLNPQHFNQLSENTTPLDQFFTSVHKMYKVEDMLVTEVLQSTEFEGIAKTGESVRVIIVNIFATECSLFTSFLVMVALFAERCFASNHIVLQQLIDIVNILIKKAKRFIAVLKQIEFLAQFSLLIYKLQTSILSNDFLQGFAKFSVSPHSEDLRKNIVLKLKKATLEFAHVSTSIEKKSAFGKVFKQQYQDLLSDQDPHRSFIKSPAINLASPESDPFETFKNVYSNGLTPAGESTE